MRRWFRVEHALHWAGVLFATVVLASVLTQLLTYEFLARRGRSATATVLAYEPRRPSYRGGGYQDDPVLSQISVGGFLRRYAASR